MKHSFKNLFYFAVAGIMLLSSCSNDEETPAPTISIKNPPAANTSKGATVSFPLEVAALEKIESIIITKKIGSNEITVPGYPMTNGFNSSTSHIYFYDYVVTEESGDITFRFEVTDKKGKRAATSFVVSVAPVVIPPTETAMAFETTGQIIANKIGPNQSAYDLATNARKAGGSTAADMQNPSTVTNAWVKGWDGVRNTTFVKANDFNYAEATVEAATGAFAGGTILSSVTNVAVGDIYIARIKGAGQYAVIKVTQADNDNPNDNLETITFSYKKLAENSGQ